MSYDFEKLQEIGIRKLHKDTHISISYLKSILDEDFTKISRVQLNGFISILEREYNLDLSDLKDEISQNTMEQKKLVEDEDDNIFLRKKKKKKKTIYYIIFIAIVLIATLIYTYNTTTNNPIVYIDDEIVNTVQKKITESKEDTTKIQKVSQKKVEEQKTIAKKKLIKPKKLIEKKVSQVKKIPKQNKILAKPIQVTLPDTLKTFKLFPRSKVWIGIIDVKNQTKKQKTISQPISIDTQKEWLFLLGHGHINIEINDKNISYNKSANLRLHYKDGVIKQLSITEFKQLNNGRKW